VAAVDRALFAMRRPAAGLIHHSDRGSQYCSVDYQAELSKHGILISMSGKGNCYDNAMVETFFKTLKSELVWRTIFYTRRQAIQAIARYIDGLLQSRPAPLRPRLHKPSEVRKKWPPNDPMPLH
jgi:putative transposase